MAIVDEVARAMAARLKPRPHDEKNLKFLLKNFKVLRLKKTNSKRKEKIVLFTFTERKMSYEIFCLSECALAMHSCRLLQFCRLLQVFPIVR